jgi:fermentation-respiration switch protein FrsA (DUF1100 family)
MPGLRGRELLPTIERREPVSRFSRFMRALVLGITIIYLVICALLWNRQAHLIFFPSYVIDLTPANFGAKFEQIDARASGETLRGWWIPAVSSECAIVYLHGNGGNISANAAQAVRLAHLGCSVLLLDYRGYGESDGKFPSETSVYADAESMWNYAGERGFKPSQLLIYGHSLGGAIAIELARHHPDAKGLIVESSLTSVRDVADQTPAYRAFPIALLGTQHFDSIHKISEIHIPVLFIHGTADRIVPFFMSQHLFAAANQPKRLVLIPGAHHEDCVIVGGRLYLNAASDFLESSGRAESN